jgi:hypothetical protein
MRDLLSIGTSRGCEMIGVGVGLGLSGYRLNPPGALPVLDLQFSSLKTLTAATGPTPSFSRASSGTYFDSAGVLQTASTNGARFDHTYNGANWVSRGLLIEEQRTNLTQYSEDFSNAWWLKTNTTVESGLITAPDGSTNAFKLKEDTTNGEHRIMNGTGYATSIGVSYTYSVYAKKAERNYLLINAYTNADYRTWFNLDTGTVGTNASGNTSTITPVGNGWYRCTVTRASTWWSEGYFALYSAPSDNTSSFTGVSGNGIYLWGAQREVGAFPTSYIKTTNSSVVRSADVCQITGSNFSGIWNTSEGSIVLEQDFLSYSDPASDQRYFSIAATGNSPAFIFNYDNGTTLFWYRYFSGLDQLILPDVNSAFKVALAFKTSDYATVLNGGTPVTSSTKTLPTTFERIDIGYQAGSTARSSWVQRLRYYPTRLSNA